DMRHRGTGRFDDACESISGARAGRANLVRSDRLQSCTSLWRKLDPGGVMITGSVNAALEIMVHIEVQDSSGHPHVVQAQVDTGYNGALTLPPAQINALRLPWRDRLLANLADGSVRQIDMYEATIN